MDYKPLHLSTIKPHKSLTFDLFIYYGDQYLCYSKRGEQITEEKYLKLKKQKITRFYTNKSDEWNYHQFVEIVLKDLVGDTYIEIDEKISIIEGTASTAIERMQEDPDSESAYRLTEAAAKSFRLLIKNNPNVLKKIFGKAVEKNDELIKHSLNVCALALKLAETLGHSEKDLDDLGTAALIHDIGIVHMDNGGLEIFDKPRRSLTNNERESYLQHITSTNIALEGKKYLNKRILTLILNHEEVLSGAGPNKKKKLTRLEEILSLVDNYDKRMLTNKTSPMQTLKELTIDELGNYSLSLLNDFKKVLHDEGLL